jgi:hypothetical protein
MSVDAQACAFLSCLVLLLLLHASIRHDETRWQHSNLSLSFSFTSVEVSSSIKFIRLHCRYSIVRRLVVVVVFVVVDVVAAVALVIDIVFFSSTRA